jgi:hypothetical protein
MAKPEKVGVKEAVQDLDKLKSLRDKTADQRLKASITDKINSQGKEVLK